MKAGKYLSVLLLLILVVALAYIFLDQTISYGSIARQQNMSAIRSVICSQPFLLDYENLPSTLNFSAQFINCTINPSLDTNDFTVKLNEQNLTVRSVAYNESTQLYDITVYLPSLQKGRYILKLARA